MSPEPGSGTLVSGGLVGLTVISTTPAREGGLQRGFDPGWWSGDCTAGR